MAVPLYDLAPACAALADLPLERADEDEGQAGAEDLEAALATIREELTPKLLALAKVVRTLEAEAELLEEHARSLVARAGTRRRRLEFLKRWMRLQMEGAGVDKAKDAFITVWLQESPPAVDIVDEAAVPPEFKRVTLKLPLSQVPANLLGLVQTCDVDRLAIHAVIKEAGDLPAGIAFRRGARHLRIR